MTRHDFSTRDTPTPLHALCLYIAALQVVAPDEGWPVWLMTHGDWHVLQSTLFRDDMVWLSPRGQTHPASVYLEGLPEGHVECGETCPPLPEVN